MTTFSCIHVYTQPSEMYFIVLDTATQSLKHLCINDLAKDIRINAKSWQLNRHKILGTYHDGHFTNTKMHISDLVIQRLVNPHDKVILNVK